jgi:serine/threonine-protein kinase RsbW
VSRTEQQAFPARMDALGPACAFVEDFCARQGVARDDMLRLLLLVEELFTNTIDHGHGGDSDALVRLALTAEPDRLALVYEDQAPPFDPLDHAGSQPPDGDAGERPVGGLGLLLLTQLAEAADYDRTDDGNRLRLVLRRMG